MELDFTKKCLFRNPIFVTICLVNKKLGKELITSSVINAFFNT